MNDQPIGVFDSGVGGLTVFRQLAHVLPHENLIYFGDTARLPYGNKSQETVTRYCIENVRFLLQKNIKLLVVACNTGTAQALPKLEELFDIPIVGVIKPGAHKAISTTMNQCIAVLGTQGTIHSGAYQQELRRRLPAATIIPIACPLFVHLAEEHFLDHPAAKLIVEEYLNPIFKHPVDTVLLGCTHYPLLANLIQEVVGPDVRVVDSASSCADEVSRLLQNHQIASQGGLGTYQYYVSDDPERFRKVGEAFLGRPLGHIEAVAG